MAEVTTDLRTEADVLAGLLREGSLPSAAAARAVAHHLGHLRAYAARVVDAAGGTRPDTPGDPLTAWLAEHARAADLLESGAELHWDGARCRASVVAAALLTELFARGQDIADALGTRLTRTDSIGHVAYYGVRTRDAVYHRRGRTPPAAPFRFELLAPSGTRWEFGPPDASDRLTGPAEDFCLLTTGRRPARTLAVTASGPLAREWLGLNDSVHRPQ